MPGDRPFEPSRRLLLSAGFSCLATPVLARAPQHPPALPRKPARLAAPRILRHPRPPAPLVMLDPGHGGKDPGAIGVSGTYEKHVAIAAASDLLARLQATGRTRPRLTRADDHFIPLEDRVAIAQAAQAALFVSVHADAIASPLIRGASVYTLADTASDTQTAALARRENAADRFAGPRYRGVSPEVQLILADLTRDETRSASTRLARETVASLAPATRLLPNPARHAAFVVLRAPDIPSILVEMGFMSNQADEALLRTPAHRRAVTTALAAAIDRHLATTLTPLAG